MTQIEYINPAGTPAPLGQYSSVAVVGPAATTLYVAGLLAVDSTGAVTHPDDFDAQADAVFDLLARTLDGVGSSLQQVAFLRAFLVRPDDVARLRAVRRRVFADYGVESPPPATTIVVSSLIGGALVEMDAIATAPGAVQS